MASNSSTSDSPVPNWLELPEDVASLILRRLGPIEILEVAQNVCATWRKICKDPAMWQCIDMVNLEHFLFGNSLYLDKMCRHAVDRSCGRLQKITLMHFNTDNLVPYIADRAPQLRSLRLMGCYGSSSRLLDEVAKKMPNLEELYTSFSCGFTISELAKLGRGCPKLKSLSSPLQVINFGAMMEKLYVTCPEHTKFYT